MDSFQGMLVICCIFVYLAFGTGETEVVKRSLLYFGGGMAEGEFGTVWALSPCFTLAMVVRGR